jgi:ditrans,polycis-polyprenyl diphosphate synthase|mmetsp:Transcript_12603/g.36012  ORF Transcript_12603/g.36012 Transcript_12603/m.36012 type:complete len:295 (-) Transcript_12603:209-1093(-)|eukprot:CAMPEP_0182611400 /NCGR_PEP_ID=MMETSP1330-20130603/13758_1 /TAXON_ID=464278 /ORGANISM="Picochlorum sp., Strain RCC944" /LENGTH=294 /DNA_ID=CAMNT_0024830791 /DNA_START=174 /DNA_END=1058 /DNA_ORIENTATION=-
MAEFVRDAYRALRKSVTERLAKLALSALKEGDVPKHIAFVMDGNRRYADRCGEKPIQGHISGYGTLLDVLQWCNRLCVSTVSVYAFSIDNYTRSDEEVCLLMELVEEKLRELEEEAPRLRREGVKVQVLGDLSLAPSGVQEASRRVMEATAANDACVLNVLFSYTASEELVRAGRRLENAASPGQHVDDHLYVGEEVDLLIRTSGETRLSDFMLRQSRCCVLHFTETLWPDFGLVDLLEAVTVYQRHARALGEARDVLSRAKKSFIGPHRSIRRNVKDQDGSRSPSSVLSVEDE